MSTVTKKPPIKQTVGAQYVCFNTMDANSDWTNIFEEEVEKTEVVKSVKITENSESSNMWASGKVYDSDTLNSGTEIETEVLAFPDDTLAKMRGDVIDEGGLVLAGGNGVRPYFAYGKVVKLKNDKFRYEWYPKCKLTENSDEVSTKEEKASEQTDTIKISAMAFNDHGDIVAKVGETNFPTGLTEDKFFAKPIMTATDLTTAIGATTPPETKPAEDTEPTTPVDGGTE